MPGILLNRGTCQVGAAGDKYTTRSFVFSKPRETDAKQATGLNFEEGRMELTVRHRA